MKLLASLNPQQREAVMHTEGPLLILAGAGSGKTRVVVSRIGYLILERGVAPESILGVTFTNKAAGEMRERVERVLREGGAAGEALPAVSTFHSFCVRILRRHGAPLAQIRPGFTPGFLICDDSDQLGIVKSALGEVGPEAKSIKPRDALSAISRAKNHGVGEVRLRGTDRKHTEILNAVYSSYRDELLETDALDFDDLLREAVRLLQSFDDVRTRLQARYQFLLVDEFQDTNKAQYEIVRLLAGKRRNICVVGDDDQSIYSWRGAEIGNILNFETDYPAAKVVRLEQNYRSTARILEAASALVDRNTRRQKKRLWTDGPQGERPVLYCARDGIAEARYVAGEIRRLLESDPTVRVGLLYRTNWQSRPFEEALRQENLNFLLVGGVGFYQRAEVRDLLAYVKAAASPDDAVNLRRIINVPARGIGKSTLGKLEEFASQHGVTLWKAIEEHASRHLLGVRARTALARFRFLMTQLRDVARSGRADSTLQWVLEETGYRRTLESDKSADSEGRLDNLKELIGAARESAERGESLAEFLDFAALVSDSDGIDQAARVLLMTLHNAKGLEFPAVALVGMDDGLLPHSRSLAASSEALEEERRLCYVGMTRARRHLLLTRAASRRQFGASDSEDMRPSQFLKEIPVGLLEDRTPREDVPRTAWRFGADRPVPGFRDRAKPPAGTIITHNSVSAVAGFFKDRGINIAAQAGSGAKEHDRPAGTSRAADGRPGRARPTLGQARKTLRSQRPFARGTRVRHSRFGVGVVQRREGEGPGAKLSIYFRDYGLKKLVAGYANLQVE